ncbi:MAG: long-chain fatty acid--CoA ligase [Rhodospirillales bacterium]|nr:long-chain fatty acid--CoA ligase [Rhodospirillales bacterium]MSP79900.1 long-chain fatty acid--CoA ligase [Rhodospirillales bacterium]
MTIPAAASAADTLPKLVLDNARRRGHRAAFREKDYGIWQQWTWQQAADEIRALACGLAALGLKRGDKLTTVGDNRPRLYWAMVATQAIGGVPVPVYQDSVAAEMGHVLAHAGVRFAVAENQEQVDKLIEIKEICPELELIVYCDSRGLKHYAQPYLKSYAEVQEMGRAFATANPDFFDATVACGQGGEVALITYTSGTTGQSKGVMLTFANLIETARNAAQLDGLGENEEMLSYLPMAWVGDIIFSLGQSYVCGFCISCPESAATVLADLREIGPTYFFAPPRIFENILTSVMIRIEDASAPKRGMFRYFMNLARRVGADILDGKPVPPADRLLYALGEALVYGPLRNVLGFSRVRLAYTAGEAIGPDIFRFYRSLGVNIKQLYGSTESSVFVTVQPDGHIKADSVGVPVPGVEIRVAESGEVMFRGPGVFHSYYKNEEATRATKTPDGWVRTGDAGFVDADGQLHIIDRAKDVGRMKSGGIFAPKYIENKLKFFPYIREAVAFGDERDFVTAFLNIDLAAVGNWAERRGLAYSGYADLAQQPVVLDLLDDCVRKVNADLASESRLADSQIRRFLVLHKELDADDGELTRTRKLRRAFVVEKYAPLAEALYSGRDRCAIETEVTFENGRKGRISAELIIRDVPAVPTLCKAG